MAYGEVKESALAAFGRFRIAALALMVLLGIAALVWPLPPEAKAQPSNGNLLEGKSPVIRTNDWQILAEATRSGAGVSVLPCYLADPDPCLRRIGTPLKEVVAEQWLLVHRDLRALPHAEAAPTHLLHRPQPA